MPNQIQPQADVGGLGLRGLEAFSSVLAILSADNVTPMAMIQMEQLGAVFHINGRFATAVPELLTRCSSRPVGRLSLAAGWRRNDSISLLAESAGGQAISILSVCLTNLYREEAVGDILSRLGHKLLPKTFPSAGITHLADVATLVASKLNRLGFGNVLAEQTSRVKSVYEQLGITAPGDLLELLTVESMVDIFECLSHLTEVDSVIRITGSSGILHILAIIIFMFPLDTTVTVESFVIHQGPNGRIAIEIRASEPVQIRVEKQLNQPPVLVLPIQISRDHSRIAGTCSFTWDGWLARDLQLEFARFGATCNQQVLVAFCTILVDLAPKFKTGFERINETHLPRNGIEGLLGLYSRNRMQQICQEVLLESPDLPELESAATWAKFTSTLEKALQPVACLCSKCLLVKGWPSARSLSNTQRSCPRYQLWEIVGKALTAGLCCLPINARGSVAIPGKLPQNNMADVVWHHIFSHGNNYGQLARVFLDTVLRTFSANERGSVGRSSGACTIFPTVLETFEVHPDGVFGFELCDGLFVFEGRYYRSLSCDSQPRPRASETILDAGSPIMPSSHGEHSSITVTLREGYNQLLLEATVNALGSYSHVDVASVVLGYMGLERTQECEHERDSPLSKRYRGKVIATSVNMPRALNSVLALAMTRSNAVAQFLCCEGGARCLLLQGCCLDCGVEQASGKFDILIVS